MERVGEHFEFLSRAQGVSLDQVKQRAHGFVIHPLQGCDSQGRSAWNVHVACNNPSPPYGMCEGWYKLMLLAHHVQEFNYPCSSSAREHLEDGGFQSQFKH